MVGEEIANLLDPPENTQLPSEAQAIVSNLNAQLQAAMQENQALHMDRAGRVMEQQTKKEIEVLKSQQALIIQKLKIWGDLTGKELAAKSRSTDQIAEQDASHLEAVLGFAHDAASQTLEHHHDHALADKQAAAAKDLATHQQAIQPQEPEQPGSSPGA